MNQGIVIPGIIKLQSGGYFSKLRSSPVPLLDYEISMLQDDDGASPEAGAEAATWERFLFRALSKRYLGAGGYFLDFSKGNVLKDSIPLMLDASRGGELRKVLKFVRDHSRDYRDSIGFIDEAIWSGKDKSLTSAGINTWVNLHSRRGADEIEALSSDPPLVDAVSLAVFYNWEKSHEDMEDYEFISTLGREVDGQIVRLVVTEILRYGHLALVDDGGDAEAGMLSESGTITTFAKNGQHKNNGDKKMELNLNESLVEQLKQAFEVETLNGEKLLRAVVALKQQNQKLESQVTKLEGKAEKCGEMMKTLRQHVKDLAKIVDKDNAESLFPAIEVLEYEELVKMQKVFEKRRANMFGRSSIDTQELGDQTERNGKQYVAVDPSEY